jgi:hypothetical protein
MSSLRNKVQKLEDRLGTEQVATGKPIRPLDMSDKEYEQAIHSKRKELGLRDSQDLPILALCM